MKRGAERSRYEDFLALLPEIRELDNVGVRDRCRKLIESETEGDILRFFLYLRDPERGLGEKRIARIGLEVLFREYSWRGYSDTVDFAIEHLVDYGSGDDIFYVVRPPAFTYQKTHMIELSPVFYTYSDHRYPNVVTNFHRLCRSLVERLDDDRSKAFWGKCPSSLVEQMPSLHADDSGERKLADQLRCGMHWSEKKYDKTLDKLKRKREERRDDNEYSKSRMNEKRRDNMAEDTKRGVKGGEDIYPHDVVHEYSKAVFVRNREIKAVNDKLEKKWAELRDLPGLDNTIVVADNSESMLLAPRGVSTYSSHPVTCLEIGTAALLYAAPRCRGYFKDKRAFFTPQGGMKFADISQYSTLHDRLEHIYAHSDVVYPLSMELILRVILNTAIRNKVSSEDMPTKILVVADSAYNNSIPSDRDVIDIYRNKYAEAGYILPEVIWWNLFFDRGISRDAGVNYVREGIYELNEYSPRTARFAAEGVDAAARDVRRTIETAPFASAPVLDNVEKRIPTDR